MSGKCVNVILDGMFCRQQIYEKKVIRQHIEFVVCRVFIFIVVVGVPVSSTQIASVNSCDKNAYRAVSIKLLMLVLVVCNNLSVAQTKRKLLSLCVEDWVDVF